MFIWNAILFALSPAAFSVPGMTGGIAVVFSVGWLLVLGFLCVDNHKIDSWHECVAVGD